MRLTCVVDDAVQRDSRFWGEHGLSFLIDTGTQRVLFDVGQSGTVLLHNLALLDVDLVRVDALAISHAHYDHTGGLPAILPHLRPGVPLVAHPDLFRWRGSQRDGRVKKVGLSVSQKRLANHLELRLSPAPQEIVPGVWTTGGISERRHALGQSPYHVMREGGALVPDAYYDDMALVVQLGSHLMLLCGCCHAGLLNTLAHVKRTFEQPIVAIAGGLHLIGATQDELRRIGHGLAELPTLRWVYPNHCTGEAAYVALTQRLGVDVVRPAPAGARLHLEVQG